MTEQLELAAATAVNETVNETTSGIRGALVAFTVHGIAQPAGSKRAVPMGGRWGVIDDNRKGRPWKTEVATRAAAAMAGAPLLDGPLRLDVVFTQPRPKSHYGRRGLLPSARPYPTTKPDVTKLLRAVEDAMTSIVYRDDAQIVEQHAWKRYGEPACVSIVVRPAQPQEAP